VEPTQLSPIERAIICLRTPTPTLVRLINPAQHKPTSRINFSLYWICTRVEPNLYTWHCFMDNIIKNKIPSESKSSPKAQIFTSVVQALNHISHCSHTGGRHSLFIPKYYVWNETGRRIMSRSVIVMLTCIHHKPTDLINLFALIEET
jgi:hypothetical protein